MRDAPARRLCAVYGLWLVAAACSGAEPSSPDGQQIVGSGAAGSPQSSVTPAAGAGAVMTAPPVRSAGGAGMAGRANAAAGGSGGSAVAPGGSAGQVGAATAGVPSAGVGGAGVAGSAGVAGGAGALGSGAAAGSGAAGTPGSTAPAGGPCPLPLPVDDGVPVNGAGCHQQWEGIVMTRGGRGLCTAAFISDRHLISASHCYASDGSVSVDVSAPTWNNGMGETFQATVKRSGGNMSLDVSVIDLGEPVAWATPERRFLLHAGKTTGSVELHTYGFGNGGGSGQAGTLRGVPDRVTIKVTADGSGNLNGEAGEARLCSGDSGGPAFVEDTAAVLYAINQAIVPSGWGGRGGLGGTCAGPDWTIMFTDVADYMDFIEMALDKPCERKQVDGLEVAQCW